MAKTTRETGVRGGEKGGGVKEGRWKEETRVLGKSGRQGRGRERKGRESSGDGDEEGRIKRQK